MKREIIFRGKRLDNGKWVNGVPFIIKEEAVFIINNCKTLNFTNQDTSFDGYKVHENTIGQYTGLTDQNGKEIYEGDVLQNTKAEIGLVIWFQSGFHLECKRKNDTVFYIPLTDGFVKNKKIIGNIHDNPDLLEQIIKADA